MTFSFRNMLLRCRASSSIVPALFQAERAYGSIPNVTIVPINPLVRGPGSPHVPKKLLKKRIVNTSEGIRSGSKGHSALYFASSPVRRCVFTNMALPTSMLVRLALTTEDRRLWAVADVRGTMSGQGVWITPDADIIQFGLEKRTHQYRLWIPDRHRTVLKVYLSDIVLSLSLSLSAGKLSHAFRRKVNAPPDFIERLQVSLLEHCGESFFNLCTTNRSSIIPWSDLPPSLQERPLRPGGISGTNATALRPYSSYYSPLSLIAESGRTRKGSHVEAIILPADMYNSLRNPTDRMHWEQIAHTLNATLLSTAFLGQDIHTPRNPHQTETVERFLNDVCSAPFALMSSPNTTYFLETAMKLKRLVVSVSRAL